MFYKKFNIENFKGIKKLSFDDLQRVNLIAAKNNTVKTSILEALYIFSAPTKPDSPLLTMNIRGINYFNQDVCKSLFHKMDVSSIIKFTGETVNKEKRELEIKIRKSPEQIPGQRFLFENSFSGFDMKYKFLNENEKKPKEIITSACMVKGKLELAPANDEGVVNSLYLNPFLSFVSKDLVIKLNNILMRKKSERLIKALKQIEPSLNNIMIGVNSTVFADIGLDSMVPVSLLGSSFNALLSILVSLMEFPNSILLIDGIENATTNIYLETSLSSVIKFAKEFNIQIFMTTTSMECMKALNVIYGKIDPNGDELRTYRIEKKEDLLKITGYDRKKLEIALKTDLKSI